MSVLTRFAAVVAAAGMLASLAAGQSQSRAAEIVKPKDYQPPMLVASPALKAIVDAAVSNVVNSYRAQGFKNEEIAVTLIDLSEGGKFRWADFRGDERIYPASVVKMFYMAALERQLEDKKAKTTTELERGLREMIVDSSNDATQYIVDVLTDTSSGPELPKKEFDAWQFKRNRMNRWFASMGYTSINVNQKTYCEDAYGIEQQSRNYKGENRNALTTNATARLLAEIVTGRINTPERTRRMMELLLRDPFSEKKGSDESQAHDFIGRLLIERKMTDTRIWSKAGWTSKSRHDAAYVETADGLKFVLVIFTENHSTLKDPIPMIVGTVIDGLHSRP